MAENIQKTLRKEKVTKASMTEALLGKSPTDVAAEKKAKTQDAGCDTKGEKCFIDAMRGK